MTSLDFLEEGWLVQRKLYLAQGLDQLVAEADALSRDEEKFHHAPSTFKHEWEAVQRRLREESGRKMDEDGGVVAKPLLDWVELAKSMREARFADIGERLRTPRGLVYLGFLMFAQMRLEDWNLASVTSMRPEIANALGTEIEEALKAQHPEMRTRQMAAATMRVVEVYYKPLLQIVWSLTARLAGYTKKTPRMCGDLIRSCRELWPTIPDMIVPIDFLDDDAVEVRNGVAHPAKTCFDVTTQELVFGRDDGGESRFAEKELRRRLRLILYRCTLMDFAFQWVAGMLPSHVLGSGKPEPAG